MSDPIFQLARFADADTLVRHDPFPFIVASHTLADSARTAIASDFPPFEEAGYFPHDANECGPALNRLIAEVTAPASADVLGDRLGIANLARYPTLVTICSSLNRRHGTIHTDSRSKVATALIYLNDGWNGSSDGCLRFLGSNDNIDAILVPEIAPDYGNFVMFKRTDNSYHGHLPYEGRRRVVQIAWITSQQEIDRKAKRGRFSRALKHLFGGFDKKIGANRGRNAAHLK